MGLIEFTGCQACTLKKEWPFLRTPRMPMTLPLDPDPIRVLILGEAPGEKEDLQSQQFIGPTGQYLRDRLPAKWKRSVYWQNVVRCQPPKNRNPTPQEMTCCSTYLEEDLLKCKPHAILGLGNIALQYFWPEFNKGISKARGISMPVALQDGSTSWLMTSFHPSYPYRADKKQDDGSISNVVEPVFRNDIIRFFNNLTTKYQTPPKIYTLPNNYIYPKSFEEAWNLFLRLDDPYTIDFETFKTKPYKRDAKLLTAAFSDGKITFAFPVNWPGDLNPWGFEFLRKAFSTGKSWVCQNGSMEYSWIRYLFGIRSPNFHDTEVLARLLHDRKGLGALEHLSRIYLGFDVKALTNLDKQRMNEYPLHDVLKYNADDSWTTHQIFNILMAEIVNRPGPFVENYIRILQTIESTVEMEILGLDVDIAQSESMQKVLYEQEQEAIKLSRSFKEVKEYEQKESAVFSISAPQDVARVLTSYCGIQLYKNEDSGYYTTDEDELTQFLGVHPLVDLTLDYREIAKQLSTYVMPILNGEILGIDGRLHPAYTTVHTFTFRLSSKDPNIQNWPKRKNREIRRQIVPPPGHLIVACDYGGLEARVIQMASKDENLKKSLVNPQGFLKDADIHWYWLHKILEKYPPYINRLADKSGETDKKKILKAGRTIIKTDFVFASFYGSQSRAVAARTQVPLNIIEEIHEELWGMYPQVKEWVDGQFKLYQTHGYVSSLTGRIRGDILPGNEVTNTPAQGTGAEIVLEAQNALYRKGVEEGDIVFLPRWNIHDDLGFFVPNSNDTDRYINVILDEMVKPRFPFITVPLLVECSVGEKNWCDVEEICQRTGDIWQS